MRNPTTAGAAQFRLSDFCRRSLAFLPPRLASISGAALFCLLVVSPVSLNAQAIVTELQAMKLVTVTADDGSESETMIPAATVVPGEKIIYTLNYGNQSPEPVNDVVISLPVPSEMTFHPGSADQSGTTVSYSVDGGITFDRLERLQVTTPEGLVRPARASDITNIRWNLVNALQPSESGTLRCIASVD